MKANNALCKYYLKGVKLSFASQITNIEYKKYFWEIMVSDNSKHQFKGLILTCPFPQLKKLAKKYLDKKVSNLKVQMQPNITVMLALKNQKELPISSIKFDDEILTWAANENSWKKAGRKLVRLSAGGRLKNANVSWFPSLLPALC